MCFGSKKSSDRQPPAPVAAPAQGATMPDISAQQKLAAVTNSTSATQAPFGSELGTGATTPMPGAK